MMGNASSPALGRWLLAGLAFGLAIGATWAIEHVSQHDVAHAQGIPRGFRPSVDEYIVETGDTLWDVTKKVAGDAFLWPRVWSYNPEIANPNWIYPGDVIRFYPRDFSYPSLYSLAANEREIPEPEPEVDPEEIPRVQVVQMLAPERQRVPRRFVGRFVTEGELKESGTLTNAADDKILLSDKDVVYLKFPEKREGLIDREFMIYRTLGPVIHPKTERKFGYMTEVTGFARVRGQDEDGVSTAELFGTQLEVERGQYVTEVRNLRPVVKKKTATQAIEAVVLAVRHGTDLIAAEDNLIFLDMGEQGGVEPGNTFVVYRRGETSARLGRGDDLPLRPVGVVKVLEVTPTASTAIVLETTEELRPGYKARAVTRD